MTHAKAIGVQYNGTKLVGRPLHTAVRGRMVMKDGVVDPEAKGWGQRLYPQK